jgi:hypothetical protein
MSTYTISTDSEEVKSKIDTFLKTLRNDNLDIYIDDDDEDIRFIKQTEGEESIDLHEFLSNES